MVLRDPVWVQGRSLAPSVPVSLALSLAVHVLGLAAYLGAMKPKADESLQVITDVDILVQQRQARAAQAPVRPKAPATLKDFLKLALPSAPKPERAPLDVSAPELKRELLKMPETKLEERGRMKQPPIDALDLGRRKMELAKAAEPLAERSRPAPMDLPKLEEVGTRRAAPKAIEAAALAEERRDRLQAPMLGSVPEPTRRRFGPNEPITLPAEAAPKTGRELGRKMLDMLTSEETERQPALRLEHRPRPQLPSGGLGDVAPASLPRRRSEEGPREAPKKAVEIEGPLSNRTVASAAVPKFPDWLRELGAVEADVSIRFYVDPAGAVLEDGMRVERTSGYGRLDRLVMDHLKRWRFSPVRDGRGNEWGIITFHFILE